MLKQNWLIVILVGCMTLAGNAFAQETKTVPTPEQRAAKLTEWMKTNLQLTEAQSAQVSPINIKYAQMTESIRTGSEGRMQKAKALKANDKAKDEELKKIFTPEQFSAYSEKKEAMKAEMKKRKMEKNKA